MIVLFSFGHGLFAANIMNGTKREMIEYAQSLWGLDEVIVFQDDLKPEQFYFMAKHKEPMDSYYLKMREQDIWKDLLNFAVRNEIMRITN